MNAVKPRGPERSLVKAGVSEKRLLDDVRQARQAGSIVLHGRDGRILEIPPSLLEVMDQALETLQAGDSVAVVPVEGLLTTQEAADLLNVSRQYLVRLLDGGQIPSTRTGSHRRVLADDVLRFKAQRDERRMAALAEIAQIHQESGGYDEP